MKRTSRGVALMACLLAMGLSLSVSAKTVTLKLIETSDIHGAFFPYNFITAKNMETSLAQIYSYIKEQRANPDQHVILLDNGDILQGQPTVYYYNFEKTDAPHICADIMNFMKYDVGTVANHDIEAGHEVYDKLVQEFQFPWLAANAVKPDGTPYFQPYTVLEKDGVKIAILGLITPYIPNWLPENLWTGMRFEGMVASAKKWVPIIQEKEHPDLFVGLFHAGVDYTYGGQKAEDPMNENASKLVAEQVPGFDIVFVGHDHQGWSEPVKNSAGNDVWILGAKNAAKTVAVATVVMTYDEATKTWSKQISGEALDVKNFPADEEYMIQFKPVMDEIKMYVDKPIGKFTQTISSRDSIFGDSAFNDLIHRIQLELTEADISFAAPLLMNAEIKAGDVFVRDTFNLYVYENLLYTMRLTGQEVKDALEYSYGIWFNQMNGPDDHLLLFKKDDKGNPILQKGSTTLYETVARYYNYDSAAGIIYTVDVSKPVGERVMIASMADGTPFDVQKDYKVAINSYRGTGGGGHLLKGAKIPKEELTNRMLSSTVKDLRYFLMKWIEKAQVVDPQPLGNWEVVPKEWWERGKAKDYRMVFGASH